MLGELFEVKRMFVRASQNLWFYYKIQIVVQKSQIFVMKSDFEKN